MADPLTVIGIFMLGASAGSILTLVRYRSVSNRLQPPQIAHALNHEGPPHHYRMKALILCRRTEIITIFSQLFREICIELESCDSDAQTLTLLRSQKFEALVLDFEDFPGCSNVVKSLRGIRPNQETAIFAIASEEQRKTAALNTGSTFVVEEPLAPMQIRTLLRSVYGRMLRSSQAYFRFNIEIPVSVARSAGPVLKCTTINLSQNGMAVKTPIPLERSEKVHLVFALPNSDIALSAEGTVIWDDAHGKAGIRFECSSESARARYSEWLHDHFFMRLEPHTVSPEVQHTAYAS